MADASRNGRTIRMFLVDGSANGVITAEIMNWTGHAVCGPRSKLPQILSRDEAAKTGVYFLAGNDPESGDSMVYIGEGDQVGKRLRAHAEDSNKDFWERVCFITSKDHNLTKAHGRYLESRLIEITKDADRVTLANSTGPAPGKLPEADVSDMEYFINQIRLVLPVLGMDFLRPTQVIKSNKSPDDITFELHSSKHSLKAQATERDDEFLVLKTSHAQSEWIARNEHSYKRLRESLINKEKIILDTNKKLHFAEDVPFKSPSAAAAVVLGRNANGRTEWRVKGTNKTYADWQKEQLEIAKNDRYESDA